MNSKAIRVAVLIAAVNCGSVTHSADTEPPGSDLKIKLVLEHPYALPYQPIRVRACLSNSTGTNMRVLSPYDRCGLLFSVTKPNSTEFVAIRIFGCDSVSPRVGHDRASFRFDSGIEWILEPGKQWCWSAPLCQLDDMILDSADSPDQVAKPLFPVAGTYQIRARINNNTHKSKDIPIGAAEIVNEIIIEEPKDGDAKAFQAIRRSRVLSLAVLTHAYPPPGSSVSILRAFIRDHPNSSYTPFIRLAVARYHLLTEPQGDWRELTEDDRKAAITELDAVLQADKSFAVRPSALVLMMRADPERAKELIRRLEREYPSSMEWIEAAASLPGMTPERWRDEVRKLPNSAIAPASKDRR